MQVLTPSDRKQLGPSTHTPAGCNLLLFVTTPPCHRPDLMFDLAWAQEKEEELEQKQREMRQRLLVAGNAAAADALLIKPQGFDWASDFKARVPCQSVSTSRRMRWACSVDICLWLLLMPVIKCRETKTSRGLRMRHSGLFRSRALCWSIICKVQKPRIGAAHMMFRMCVAAQELSVDIVAERIFEEMSAAGTAHALPLNFRSVPEVRRLTVGCRCKVINMFVMSGSMLELEIDVELPALQCAGAV